MTTCPHVDRIAFTLLGMPEGMQARLLVDALNAAFASRPELPSEVLIPWTEKLLAEIRERLAELEQTEGHG
jgi:hypothetical protein